MASKSNSQNENHLILKEVLLYYPEENSYFPTIIEFVGRSGTITTYENGKPRIISNTYIPGDKETSLNVLSQKDNFAYVEVDNLCFDDPYRMRLSIKELELLKEYLESFNREIRSIRIEFNQEVFKILGNIFNDSEFFKTAKNFMAAIPQDIYLDPAKIVNLEALIQIRDDIGSGLFLSTEQEREDVTSEEVTGNEDFSTTTYHVKHEDILVPFREDYLSPFAKIIDKRYSLNDDVFATYIAHKLLIFVAIQHYANDFNFDYPSYFPDINELTVNKALKRYCSIETIDPKNMEVFGKFVYYIILLKNPKDINYLRNFSALKKKRDVILEGMKVRDLEKRLKKPYRSTLTMLHFERMTNQEFQDFFTEVFHYVGYDTLQSMEEGDKDWKTVGSKNGVTAVILADKSSEPVGSDVVRLAIKHKKTLRLHKAFVITSHTFTSSARALAEANEITLWDRDVIREKIIPLIRLLDETRL